MTIGALFEQVFETAPAATADAPGRVNLIGEHTDYNGGDVLPLALPLVTEVAIGPSPKDSDEVYSARFDETAQMATDASARSHWADYASGALQAARRVGWLQGPARLAVRSDVPDGAGLSSSAAIIVAILKAAARHAGAAPSITGLARLAQAVEHDHIGVPCGIMDQMAVAAGEKQHAMRLNTLHLCFDMIPVPSTWRLAVVHSGVTRKLDDGRYAERRKECEEAASMLGADHLCLMTETQRRAAHNLPEPLAKRAAHVCDDHARVAAAAKALIGNDIKAFGAVLNEGHASLRDNFEVSTPEIDRLVAIARDEGAVGARLTGGGFGGCIVACIANEEFDGWFGRISRRYEKAKLLC